MKCLHVDFYWQMLERRFRSRPAQLSALQNCATWLGQAPASSGTTPIVPCLHSAFLTTDIFS